MLQSNSTIGLPARSQFALKWLAWRSPPSARAPSTPCSATGAATGSAYQALADRIRLLILDGRIPVDTRLPAERDLAERLGLSRTTVTAAYRHLREQGLVRQRARLGQRRPAARRARDAAGTARPPTTSTSPRPRRPPCRGCPTSRARRVDDLPAHLARRRASTPSARRRCAQAIADRYTARGLPDRRPTQIMVTIGAQHAIALLSRALIARGDRALIEAPTYPHAYEALRAAARGSCPWPSRPHDDAGDDDRDETSSARAGASSTRTPSPPTSCPTSRTRPAAR